jgi:4-methyl-5(b-hydroxyethyl)-thiazole monophosphate biosynthesis
MPNVFIFLADGFEEIEAVTPLDFLRRAGIDAAAVSITERRVVTGSHGIALTADRTMAEIAGLPFDAVVLPGGMPGSTNLAASGALDALIKEAAAGGKLIAAICAAPAVVLAPKGVLAGKKFTCYPGMEKEVSAGAVWLPEKVVVDGNLITSRGPGTAALFALAVIEKLAGKEIAQQTGKSALAL